MIKLRLARISDCKFWWEVRNEKSVREASFDSKPIPYSIHKKWFEEKLKSKSSKLFIIFFDNKKIGQLRLGENNSKVEISLALSPAARGKGFGTEAIKLGAKYAIRKTKINKIVTYTKPENLASIAAFEKAGFKNKGKVNHKNQKAILLEFTG